MKEYILQVSLIQAESTDLILKGHEIAWDEFIIQKKIIINDSIKSTTFKIAKSTVYEIFNDKSVLHIDKKTGEILNWSFNYQLLTNKPIVTLSKVSGVISRFITELSSNINLSINGNFCLCI